jgi:hypothetical protein
MKLVVSALSILFVFSAIGCPQFSAVNAVCTDEGESFPVSQISLQGNAFTLVVFGQTQTQNLPYSESTGQYTIKSECVGNSVVTTETFGSNTAVSTTTVNGNRLISSGQTMVLGCPTGDCDNGPLTFDGIAEESFSCVW